MKRNAMIVLAMALLSLSASAVTVKFATVAPTGTPWASALENIKKEIKAKDKSIQVKIFLGGQLGGELEILNGIRRGRIQGGGVTSGALASVVKELGVLELPYLFESSEEADFVLDNYLWKPFTELLAKKQLVLAMWSENGWRHIGHKTKLIKSPEDLKGVKLRSQESTPHLAFWNKLQASPSPIAIPEVLPALQTGVVKGFDNTPLFALAAEWHTAIKKFSMTGHIYQPAAVVYSKRFWDKLSDKQKEIILGRGNGMAPEIRTQVRALSSELIEVLKASGIEVHKVSDDQQQRFKKLGQSVHEAVIAKLGGRSKEIYDLVLKGKAAFKSKAK